ncbi:MAG: hypothetical protein AAF797_06240 [Planctomycetota bacterium]
MQLTIHERRAVEQAFGPEMLRLLQNGGTIRAGRGKGPRPQLGELSGHQLSDVGRALGIGVALAVADIQELSSAMSDVLTELMNRPDLNRGEMTGRNERHY